MKALKAMSLATASLLGLGLATAATAQDVEAVLNCEFVRITPANADFFSTGFRPYPVVGTKVQIDFGSEEIKSMTFADGEVFFAEGEGTLTRLNTRYDGFGGIRVGRQGLYIAFLNPPLQLDEAGQLFSSRLSVTQASFGGEGELITRATHSGELECRPVTSN